MALVEGQKAKSPSEIRREKEKEKKKKKKEKEKKEKKEKAKKLKKANEDKAYGMRMKRDREFVKKAFAMGFNLGITIVEKITKRFEKGRLENETPLAGFHEGDEDSNVEAHALARDLGYEPPVAEITAPKVEVAIAEPESIEDRIEERVKGDLLLNGMTEEEVDTFDLAKAWQAHQIQTLTREIADSKNEEHTYTTVEVRKEFSLLRGLWDEALYRMEETTNDARMTEILELTSKEFDDPKPLQSYLAAKKNELSKEEIDFIKCSIEIKKFRAHGKELLYGKEQDDSSIGITEAEYKAFVDTNTVGERVLRHIAQKIKKGEQMTTEEIAIYSGKGAEVEAFLKA